MVLLVWVTADGCTSVNTFQQFSIRWSYVLCSIRCTHSVSFRCSQFLEFCQECILKEGKEKGEGV